ncbi:MAG: carboxymuconolactone decarboxylase family protein [Acidimicrobiia bacterium]|jgi:4-carboxymuconolactone decarboxylase|nr:carboxymuconolactone decarboxylase family protein [Actinomycetota bacterium]NDB04784.1 carboxymuconolactone decarboxylase family protein [Acidimicrobiia bacterium]NDA77895.1 carboxymuconolactone decarboxylase family protein [Actinomycetota bacterium]NDE59358.1 carboxymuconolactone decarboxylase family protein [Acidimicrobiia bacterium]NDF32658.1 carboxymuconolactone decarboxylase family protein [Acidimicrobiia bacterium]
MTREQGRELAGVLFKGLPPSRAVQPDLMLQTIDHLFGEIWQDARLTVQQRSLITCTVLVATGREAEQYLHFRGARNLGIERSTLEAMITHVAHYAGWPVAVSASRVLGEVWEMMDEQEKTA